MCYIECMKSKNEMTLDRVLSRFGLASRTAACAWIKAGRVKVNGRVIRDPDLWVHLNSDRVFLDGKRLRKARRLHLLFYKPKGVVTSHGDPEGRSTVYDYLDDSVPWVTPVGRLDKDSSGLLLLTNDTDFANFVADPTNGIAKTYLVKLNGVISREVAERLTTGVRMKRGDLAVPSSVRHLGDFGKYSRLEIVLQEGKNREVRRMMEAVGFKVLKLVRTGIGPLSLERLQIGKYRTLSPTEVAALKASGSRISRT